MAPKPSFTGQQRRHGTRWTVLWSERLARSCITVGGIGTILAVSAICLFLFWVVIPLFWPGSITPARTITPPWQDKLPLLSLVDEYQLLGCALLEDGSIEVCRLDTGAGVQRVKPEALHKGAALTVCSQIGPKGEVALGFADGAIQLGKISFGTSFLDKPPPGLENLGEGQAAAYETGLVYHTASDQFRLHKIKVELEPPSKPSGAAVLLIDQSHPLNGQVISVLTSDGKLRTSMVEPQPEFVPEDVPREITSGVLALPWWDPKDPPRWLKLTGVGDNVYLIWEDGRLQRIGVRNVEKPETLQAMRLLDTSATVTSVQFMLGKAALLVGDSSGRVQAWYPVRRADGRSRDGMTLEVAHTFAGPSVDVMPPGKTGMAATCLTASNRGRTMAVGYADGQVRVFYVTSEKLLGEVRTKSSQPVRQILLTPRDDGLVVQAGSQLESWSIDPGYPEITFKALFRPIWYEGYEEPAYVYQASGGDAAEPKYSLVPLIFGTLKGAFYALLLAVPLALLAAVYTSEFLHRGTRAVVKPTIEVMASLPSVVLGFLAAQVLAPFVQDLLPAVLSCFLTLPLAFLLGAYVWQLLPQKLSLALERWRFFFGFLVLPLGLAGAALLGPLLEKWLFQGNMQAWLRGGQDTPRFPGWFLVLLPLAALLTTVLMGQVIPPFFRRLTRGWSRFNMALADLVRFIGGCLWTVGMAAALAGLLSLLGFDIRGSLIGKYEQRNALVVSFMMGFAIIPLIYTIAEDALSLVPQHLRLGLTGVRRDALADGHARHHPDGHERAVFGGHGRPGPGCR